MTRRSRSSTKPQSLNQIMMLVVLVLGLAAFTFVVKSNQDPRSRAKMQKPTTVVNFWPNPTSGIPNTNISGYSSFVQMNGNQITEKIEFTQTTDNTNAYAAYGTTFNPVVFTTNTVKAAIYGWTEADCGASNAGFTLYPLHLVSGLWETFGGQISFGTLLQMQQMGNCVSDPAHPNGNWNAFKALVTYTDALNGQSVSAAVLRFFNADANTPPGKKFEIAKLTLCDNPDQSSCPFEAWPPEPSPTPAPSATPPPLPSPLPAPTLTGAAANCRSGVPSIALLWTPVAGAESYDVAECTGSSCTPNTIIASVTNTSYNDTTGVSLGTTYGYRVRAVDNGVPGSYSTPTKYVTYNCPATF